MNDMSRGPAEESTEDILGFRVENAGIAVCAAQVLAELDNSKLEPAKSTGRWLACINPHSYVQTTRDPIYRDALKSADWLIPDGTGIALASRVFGGQIRGPVTGSDIFRQVMLALDEKGGCRVFFLGSTEETLQKIEERSARDYPNISTSSFSPPFKPEFEAYELDDIVKRITSARPDVLWVGLTAPKQEKLLSGIVDRIDVGFAAAIGAVFDFYAGTVKRSHPVFQRAGLEWLPRLLREPRRLWRRTFISMPIFLWHVLAWKAQLASHSGSWQDP
jgi:N-acetylglucosaminyldiphosphoundecaprenol N-acetyl-beta-D-mannosaminyltransferase